MKSKKEIEQLAIKHANLKPYFDRAEEEYYNSGAINAYESFMHGYTQCQEDMQKDVEYWQGESDHWYQQAMEMADKYNNSLNKQD
jgi:hypothetical protein